jgi:uncharacterized protein DUF4129
VGMIGLAFTARRRLTLAASVVSAAGLLIAVAATVELPRAAGDAPGGSLVVRLADPVRAIVLGLLMLSAIILFAMVGWERRPLSEAVLERYRQRRRLPSWLAALLSLPIMLPLAALAYLVWARSASGPDEEGTVGFAVIARLFDLLAHARKPDASVPLFDAAIAALAVTVALAVFAVAVLVALPERLLRGGGDAEAAALDEPVASALDDLRAEPDARVAIIRAYARFEQALARVQAPRTPSQTPSEVMRATLARLPVPRPALEGLTALFEVARFSDRHVGLDARDEACDCLDAIQAALEGEQRAKRETATEQDPALAAPSLERATRTRAG